MAVLEAPVRSLNSLHQGPFVNEPLTNFTKDERLERCVSPLRKFADNWDMSTTW